jgi:hypothetical protein
VKAKKLVEGLLQDRDLDLHKETVTDLLNDWGAPDLAKYLYKKEGFSLDAWRKSVELVSIWRKPMPQELLENELIEQIVKTIPSL